MTTIMFFMAIVLGAVLASIVWSDQNRILRERVEFLEDENYRLKDDLDNY